MGTTSLFRMIMALQRQREWGNRSEEVNTDRTTCISYTTAHTSGSVRELVATLRCSVQSEPQGVEEAR